jgi:prepilin-type processing-associated H-X9-DG protein
MLTSLIGFVLFAKFDATPQATVQGALDSFNKRDWTGFFSRFEGAKVEEAAKVLNELLKASPAVPNLDYKLGTFTITGDSASGSVTFDIQISNMKGSQHAEDQAILKKTGDDWKIVSGGSRSMLFGQFAAMAKDPSKMQTSRAEAKNSVLLSNMKQLALSVILFITDHDEKFGLTQAKLKDSLYPYSKSNNIWLDADKKPMDVRINPNILGKPMSSFTNPATTVMLSIGPKEKLVFVEGRTPIAYLDGHVKYVTPEGAKTLNWK